MKTNRKYDEWDEFVAELRARRKAQARLWMFAGIIVAGLLVAADVFAKPQDLSWNWPTVNCDGEAMSLSDLVVGEVAVDTSPMVMPSDTAGPCSGTDDPAAPVTAIVAPVTPDQTTVTVNLQPGVTYYARIRVSAYIDGNWSSWSQEKAFIVPYGKPGQPIWIN